MYVLLRFGARSLFVPKARYLIPPKSGRYIPSRLDAVEEIENYCPGGYHPMMFGDLFDQRRFKVLNKLGYGGSSTVWLVRDQRDGKLVTLKAMRVDDSSKQSSSGIPELVISKKLGASLHPSKAVSFQTIKHHFFVQGPNGSHLFLISSFAGPSVFSMSDCPGRVAGSQRLRADLARKVAKATTTALHHMHDMGIVHGDITTSNILFRLSSHVHEWSDDEVYGQLGKPETEDVETCDGLSPLPHAPTKLVGCIPNSTFCDASLLQESTIVSDFGQSYVITSPPPSYQPGTLLNYLSPEARFEHRAGFEADIWLLGSAIFEIRAGSAFFESFLSNDVDILKQTIETLERLPDPWWGAFEQRSIWFEEDGQPKREQDQELAGVLQKSYGTEPIRAKLLQIGRQDDMCYGGDGPMMERPGVPLSGEEVELLSDLLEKMLRYRPEAKIRIKDVIRHPWFNL